MKKEKFENILDQALELQKQGKKTAEILNLFPEHKEELKDILKTISVLDEHKIEVVKPDKDSLAQILCKLPSQEAQTVTNNRHDRYIFTAVANKGRDLIQNLIDLFNMNKKIYIGAGSALLITVVVGIVFMQTNSMGTSSPELASLTEEGKSFAQDLKLSNELAQDDLLETLDGELAMLVDPETDDLPDSPEDSDDADNETDADDQKNQQEPEDDIPEDTTNYLPEIEDLDQEFEDELDGLFDDLSDLNQMGNDSFLDGLDGGLGDIG